MLTIRWATVEDARGVAVVHVDAWRAAYTGLIDQAVLDGLSVDRRAAMWANWIERSLNGESNDVPGAVSHRLLVAEEADRVVGWASFGIGRDEDSTHLGELAGLYAHPDTWSQGVGHALIERVTRELRQEGWAQAYLWVLNGNERAIRFYESHGWHADGGEKFGDAGGARGLHELRHVRQLG